MKKLKIEFENCYGIKKLKYVFDFESRRTYTKAKLKKEYEEYCRKS